MRSLIIDDNPADRNVVKGIVTNFGKCQEVTSGKIAIALVKKALKTSTYFDVITLNPDLPDRDGIEVLLDIRNAEEQVGFNKTKRALIFMIAAGWDKDRAVTAFSAGCDDFLLKPLDKEKVTKFFNEQIGLKRGNIIQSNEVENEYDQELPFKIIIDRFTSGKIDLPYAPQISIQFNEVVKKNLGFKAVANVLKQDMAISSKLISIANSAYYGSVIKTENVDQVLSRLGLVVTKQYVDAFCSRPLFGNKIKIYSEFLEELWVHSLNCAVISEITAKVLDLQLQSDPFINGLLHDIGKAVLLQSACQLSNQGLLTKDIDYDALLRFVDKYHNKVGSRVLKMWKFPYQTIHVALNHDRLDRLQFHFPKELLVVPFRRLHGENQGWLKAWPRKTGIALEETWNPRAS